MAAPGSAPIHISFEPASAGSAADELLTALLRANPQISDLIFSPGREVQVQVNAEFVAVDVAGSRSLTADDTRQIASHLIGENKAALAILREQGFCDISYALPGVARFRVNVFIQRGSCAVVMRVIPTGIPELRSLGAPPELENVLRVRSGLVLVSGPRACGKSSTLAAMVNAINETQACHILTIEDPIEFLHNHKRATVHQRELHSDTPSISHAMRAALRQAPNVIVVGELKDRGSMELALDGAESGHLVLSTFNAPDALKTIERFSAMFPAAEQTAIRERLAKMLVCVLCQRLIPRKKKGERVAVFEMISKQDLQPLIHSQIRGRRKRPAFSTTTLDGQIESLVSAGIVDAETARAYLSKPSDSGNCSK